MCYLSRTTRSERYERELTRPRSRRRERITSELHCSAEPKSSQERHQWYGDTGTARRDCQTGYPVRWTPEGTTRHLAHFAAPTRSAPWSTTQFHHTIGLTMRSEGDTTSNIVCWTPHHSPFIEGAIWSPHFVGHKSEGWEMWRTTIHGIVTADHEPFLAFASSGIHS